MADAVYAIEDFPDDDLLWRIEWIGGVGYNTSVPSDPQIEICLAASRRRNEFAQREIMFLSNKENSENRRWPTGDPHRDAFKFTLAHFPGNDGVQTDVVDYDESPGTPANRASGYQLELGCHRLFFATDSGGNAFPS